MLHNAQIVALVTTTVEGRRTRIRLPNVTTLEQVAVAMLRRGIYLYRVRFVRSRRHRRSIDLTMSSDSLFN